MITIDPHNAHESSVGTVYDVATWAPRKSLSTAVAAILCGFFLLLLALYAWAPGTMIPRQIGFLATISDTLEDLKTNYAAASYVAIIGCAMLGFMACLVSAAGFSDYLHQGYYFRAGPEGIAFRVPNGLDFRRGGVVSKVMQADLYHADIASWTVVQRKQPGVPELEAGKVPAHIDIKTRDGRKYRISLDFFAETSRIISVRIQDAINLTPADFGIIDHSAAGEPEGRSAITYNDKVDVIYDAMSLLLEREEDGGSAVITAPISGKALQFEKIDGSLILDLPVETLNDSEISRATTFFQKAHRELLDKQLPQPSQSNIATQAFVINAGDDPRIAMELAMDVLNAVHQLPATAVITVEVH